ncbi:MAG: AbrB/MazE/SpoVT family DNA-binding domain-containing protein [bacterium]
MFHKQPKMYGVSSLGERGQIVIPAKMREEIGLEKGDNFVFVSRDKFIGMIREEDMTGYLKEMLDQIEDFKKE